MDVCYTSLLFSFLLLLILLLLKLNRHGGQTANARLPPGPSKLPIIGSLHHLLGPLPHHSLAALAKQHGPVMHLKLGEVSTLVVSSPAAAAEILKAQDICFADRPPTLLSKFISYGGKGLLFAPYCTYWRELRKMSILELFSAKRVQSFRSIREDEALSLIRSIALLANTDSAVNLSRKIANLINDISARAIIGGKCKYRKEFLRLVTRTLEVAAGGFSLAEIFPSSPLVALCSRTPLKLQRLHREFDIIMDDIIQEHRERIATDEQVEQDMVVMLLKVQESGSLPFPLTDDSIKAITLELFAAGSETSATTFEWAMSELIRNSTAMERAQREIREIIGGKTRVTEDDIDKMNYLRLVIKETLRLHPPAPLLLPHQCRETREVFDYQIPALTRVLVNAWAIARDPQFWEDAEEFKPERFHESAVDFKGTNFEFIPFGAGRRMCPGMAFGLANVELPLACLLHYFDWESPAADDDAQTKPNHHELDMAETFMLTSRRRSDLRLRAIPRIPCPTA